MLEFAHKKDEACVLENRDERLRAYVMRQLSEDEEEQIEAHILECDLCFRELQFQDSLKIVAGKMRAQTIGGIKPFIYKSRIPSGRAWRVAAAAIIIMALGIYSAIRLSAPPFHELAELTQKEQDGLAVATRDSDTSAVQQEFAAGAEALLKATQKRFGLLLYFEPTLVNRAIGELRTAYMTSDNSIERNESAYFLGKAFLMQANADSACVWFDRVIAIYQRKAKNLREKLDCGEQH